MLNRFGFYDNYSFPTPRGPATNINDAAKEYALRLRKNLFMIIDNLKTYKPEQTVLQLQSLEMQLDLIRYRLDENKAKLVALSQQPAIAINLESKKAIQISIDQLIEEYKKLREYYMVCANKKRFYDTFQKKYVEKGYDAIYAEYVTVPSEQYELRLYANFSASLKQSPSSDEQNQINKPFHRNQ